jgi:hypothetical protein
VCEDGPGTDLLRLVTPEGQIFPFARVAIAPEGPRQRGLAGTADTAGETAGSPPDGRVMFFNIQPPSMTLAIWGPFRQGAAAGGSGPGRRAMARAAPPAGWLPALGGDLLARGAELGYAPTEVAALRHFGIPLR